MRARRPVTIALAALAALSMVVLSPSPASAHYREHRMGDAIGAVGSNHRSFRICELGPGEGRIHVEVMTGGGYNYGANNGCSRLGDLHSPVTRFRVGWRPNPNASMIYSAWVSA